MQPRPSPPRNSPIAGVLLTNADIDHALGLLLLRQQQSPLIVYASDETRTALGWIDAVLARFSGVEWRGTSGDFQSLGDGLSFRAIELPKSLAFQLRDDTSTATALFAPSAGEATDELREALNTSEVVLFDGTFWRDNELQAVRPGARSARGMNHLPISDGSLEVLRHSPARRKIYTHINNTNPILAPDSPERRQVERAGIEIACDGLELTI